MLLFYNLGITFIPAPYAKCDLIHIKDFFTAVSLACDPAERNTMKRCEVTRQLMDGDFPGPSRYTYGCWMRSTRVHAD